ncbi:MAG: hypothetical protein QOH03_4489 [Kribbellaceae bacterium]|jgi:hypothetical protein|nr:hypothetical protein [Kribbellaceae bacterium]
MKIRVTVAVLVLGGLTLLTGCGDKDTSNKAAPAPAPTTATSQPEKTTDPGSEETTKVTGSDLEFCAKLLSKAKDMNPGKDISQLSDDQKHTMVSAIQDLADSAPAAVKAPLTTMAQGYADVVAGKTEVTDQAAMQKIAEATLKYTQWTVTHCAPPGS